MGNHTQACLILEKKVEGNRTKLDPCVYIKTFLSILVTGDKLKNLF